MTESITHLPTPEFRDYLEWEVLRVHRGQQRWRRLRSLAVVFATLAIGMSAGLGYAQMGESAQRDSLLRTAMSDLQLAAMRLELARATVADVTARVNAGALDRGALPTATAELRRMEAHARRAQLNVEEIRATAQPPRDDLAAPRVGTTDYVMERIRLDLFVAQGQLTAAEAAQQEADRRVRVGAANAAEAGEAALAVARARAQLGVLAERQSLRKEFLERGTPGDQLTRRLQEKQVMMDAMVAQEGVTAARERLRVVQQARASGAASEIDLLRAQLALREREAELELLARQLQAMRRQQ